MNTNELKIKKMWWVKFCPTDFMSVLTMSDEEAGKYIKTFIVDVAKNNAPEGSIASQLIAEARTFREKKREAVMKRWHPERRGEADTGDGSEEISTFSASLAYAGRNGLVRLSDADYTQLLHVVGNKREADRLIDSLDNSIAEGKIYRSRHLNVLLYWNDYRQDKAREAAELKKVEAEARAEANARHGYKTAADRMDDMVKGAKHLIALNSLPEVNDGQGHP